NVPTEAVISAIDVKSIYEVPRVFHQGGLDGLLVRELGLESGDPDLRVWNEFVARVLNPTRRCVIGIVGKYTHVRDAYKSTIESFVHAGAANRAQAAPRWTEGGEPGAPRLRAPRDRIAPSPPLRAQQPLRRPPPVARPGALGQVRGARAGRDHRNARPSVVPGGPVPSRTQVAPARTASPVRRL